MGAYLNLGNLPTDPFKTMIGGVFTTRFGVVIELSTGLQMKLNPVNKSILVEAYGPTSEWLKKPVEITIENYHGTQQTLRICIPEGPNNPHADADSRRADNPHSDADVGAKKRIEKSARACDSDLPATSISDLRAMTYKVEHQTESTVNQKAMFDSFISAAASEFRRVEKALTNLVAERTGFEQKMQQLDVMCRNLRVANDKLQHEIMESRRVINRYSLLASEHRSDSEYEPQTWGVPESKLADFASQIAVASASNADDVELLYRMAHKLPIPKRLKLLQSRSELSDTGLPGEAFGDVGGQISEP